MHLKALLRKALSIPKTVYFNFKALPFAQAIKLPFFVDCNVRLNNVAKGAVQLNFDAKKFDISFGDKRIDGIPDIQNGFLSFQKNSQLIFNGKAEFANGISLSVFNGAKIEFGNNFFCNKNCVITCRDNICFCNDVLIGWNVQIRDNDGATHKIFKDGEEKPNKKPIHIGNHVWIGAYSHILKGTKIADDMVVAYNSCVTRQFNTSNTVVAGNPACVVSENINWER